MADPLTLAATIATLVGTLATVTQSCHNIWAQYHSAHHHLMSLDVECSALTTSLQAIRQIILAKHSDFQTMIKSEADATLFEDLTTTLSSCSIVITHLNEQIAKLYHATDSKRWYTFAGRAKYVWNEDAIRSLLERTRGLTGAVNLILNTLQTQSLVNVYQSVQQRHKVVLNVQQSARALQQEDDATSTIFLPNGVEDPVPNAEDANHLDELMKSPAYKRAFLKWLKQPNREEEESIDSDTNLPGSSIASLSDSLISDTSSHIDSSPTEDTIGGDSTLVPSTAGLSLQDASALDQSGHLTQRTTNPQNVTDPSAAGAGIAAAGSTEQSSASNGQSASAPAGRASNSSPQTAPQSDFPRDRKGAATTEPRPSNRIAQILNQVSETTAWDGESATLVNADEDLPPPYSLHPSEPARANSTPDQQRSNTEEQPAAQPPQPVTTSASSPSIPSNAQPPPTNLSEKQRDAPEKPKKSKSWWSFGKSKADAEEKAQEKAQEKEAKTRDEEARAKEAEEKRVARLRARIEETNADLKILREVQSLVTDRVAAKRNGRAVRTAKRKLRAWEKELRTLVGEEDERDRDGLLVDDVELDDEDETPDAPGELTEQAVAARYARPIVPRAASSVDEIRRQARQHSYAASEAGASMESSSSRGSSSTAAAARRAARRQGRRRPDVSRASTSTTLLGEILNRANQAGAGAVGDLLGREAGVAPAVEYAKDDMSAYGQTQPPRHTSRHKARRQARRDQIRGVLGQNF